MTKGILNSINTKNALYKILIQTSPTNEDVHSRLKSEYTEYRAKLRKSIREAKRLYYLRLFAIYKNDIQKTWIVINNTLNNNSRNSRQSEFIVNNNKLTNPGDIANAFNDYFINIGRQLSDKIQSLHHYSAQCLRYILHRMYFFDLGLLCDNCTHMYSQPDEFVLTFVKTLQENCFMIIQ